MNRIKVLIVDEKEYRFGQYYKPKIWWLENCIDPVFFAYENNSRLDLLWKLLFFRPKYVVVVQPSDKNKILFFVLQFLRVKTVFWQHGFFLYPIEGRKIVQCLKVRLDYLLSFSGPDERGLAEYFGSAMEIKGISHYEALKISRRKLLRPKSKSIRVGYIGQMFLYKQLEAQLGVSPWYEKLIETWVEEEEIFFSQIVDYISKTKGYELVLKKHPGDVSFCLDEYAKYESVSLSSGDDFYSCDLVIGHNSTLMIGFLQAGTPVVQIPPIIREAEDWFDFSQFGGELHRVDCLKKFSQMITRYRRTENDAAIIEEESISQQLLKIFVEGN